MKEIWKVVKNLSHEQKSAAGDGVRTGTKHKVISGIPGWLNDSGLWCIYMCRQIPIQWGHNECHELSWRLNCLLNRLFRRTSKKTSKLAVTGLCEGIHPWVAQAITWTNTSKDLWHHMMSKGHSELNLFWNTASKLGQYHAYWWPGDKMKQVITMYGYDHSEQSIGIWKYIETEPISMLFESWK